MKSICLSGFLFLAIHKILLASGDVPALQKDFSRIQKNFINSFNTESYSLSGLRIKSAKEACLIQDVSYKNDHLVISCLFINGQSKNLYFSPELLTIRPTQDSLSIELDSNTLLSFKEEQSKNSFVSKLEAVITLHYSDSLTSKDTSIFFELESILESFKQFAMTQSQPKSRIKHPNEIYFEFKKNFNIYADSHMIPEYLKDPNANIDDFANDFFDTVNESLANLDTFSLRELTDMVKIINFHCLSNKEILTRMTSFMSPDNHILNSWMIKKDILLSDTLMENHQSLGGSKDQVLIFLRDENDLLYLCEIRDTLSEHQWPRESPECHYLGLTMSEQARIRIFFYYLTLKTIPEGGTEYIRYITNEESGPELQNSELDFDYYGRFAQAGSSLKDYMKLEKRVLDSGKSEIIDRFEYLSKFCLKSQALRVYFKEVLVDMERTPKFSLPALTILLTLDETAPEKEHRESQDLTLTHPLH